MPVLETRANVADLFNPYREWLGVETLRGETPDHYRLLGLEPFEPDAERIGPAADAAMARIRRIRPGVHLADWSLLLDQLGEAKTCLLDKASKAAYDAQLAKSDRPGTGPFFGEKTNFAEITPKKWSPENIAPPPSGSAESPVSPAAVPFFGEKKNFSENAPKWTAENLNQSPSRQPTASWTGPVIVGLLVLVLGLAGLLSFALYQRGGLMSSSPRPNEAVAVAPAVPSSKDKTSADNVHSTKPRDVDDARRVGGRAIINLRSEGDGTAVDVVSEGEGNVVNVRREGAETVVRVDAKEEETKETAVEQDAQTSPEAKPDKDEAKPEKPGRPVDATKSAAFTKAADSARTAMASRDLAAAKRFLKNAEANTQTEQDAAQTKRLETMLGYLDQFWNGIRSSMAKLQPLEEIALADTRIVVIESANDYLSVKAEGRIHRFKATTLPPALITTIVQQSFGKDAGSKAVIGTFMAVDPEGDRTLAKRYWQDAARAGFEAESLMPELDSPAFAKKPGAKNANTKTNAANRQRSRYPNRTKP